jgi:hypothetical protein
MGNIAHLGLTALGLGQTMLGFVVMDAYLQGSSKLAGLFFAPSLSARCWLRRASWARVLGPGARRYE